ncbi:ribonuclease H1-like isoform X2 [Leptidea sinapis]|uniref:ribonuclease H1-like isoform X2 n=1 Tax=Leptidea sinapis TaxID=189913 RepID=UPI002136466B|nr:ribonuclease H1-like isoform X2 [Leptidea sinapis]
MTAKGRISGIFMNWGDCEAQVKGYSGARFKKFNTTLEAQEFISAFSDSGVLTQSKQKPNSASLTSLSREDLKRPCSTSTQNTNEIAVPKKKVKSKQNSSSSDDEIFDLATIIENKLNDIEKRLKEPIKGVDKVKTIQKAPRRTVLIEPLGQGKPVGGENDFETDSDGFVQVYTDGACSSNGCEGARAGLGVYWGNGHRLNVSEPVSGRATNNCGEIQAATKAIRQALDNGVQKLTINTDSQFLISSVTKWMPGWKRKGWKLKSGEPVKNEIDFKELDSIQNKLEIKWNYVKAHQGVHGNEIADQLAKAELDYLLLYSFDTELFIDEVEKRPAIWDIQCKDYSNKIIKNQA